MLSNSRLGIPLDVVEETLHGGMDGGTVFPMPCLLGATWDLPLVGAVARVIGLEARIGAWHARCRLAARHQLPSRPASRPRPLQAA